MVLSYKGIFAVIFYIVEIFMFSTAHFAAITNFNANVKIMNLFLNKLQVLVLLYNIYKLI